MHFLKLFFCHVRNAMRCVYCWFTSKIFFFFWWSDFVLLSDYLLLRQPFIASQRHHVTLVLRLRLFNLERLSFSIQSSRDGRSRDRTLIRRVQKSKFLDTLIKCTCCMLKYRCRALYHVIVICLCWNTFSTFVGEQQKWMTKSTEENERQRDLLQRRTGWTVTQLSWIWYSIQCHRAVKADGRAEI